MKVPDRSNAARLRHPTNSLRIIHVNIIEKHELRIVLLAGLEHVGDDDRPLSFPHGGLVLEPGGQIYDVGALNDFLHALLLHQVASNQFIALVDPFRVPRRKPDPVRLRRQRTGERGSDEARGTEDGLKTHC